MVSWVAPPILWGLGGGVGYSLRSLRLALVAVLLASQSLPSPHRFLSYSPSSFPLPLSPCSTWKLHGPLSVCVHVCACIYMYREIYMQGPGRRVQGWSAAGCWEPGHCPLQPIICLSHAGEIKGRRQREGCPSLALVPLLSAGRFFWMIGWMMDFPPPSSLYPSLHPVQGRGVVFISR